MSKNIFIEKKYTAINFLCKIFKNIYKNTKVYYEFQHPYPV